MSKRSKRLHRKHPRIRVRLSPQEKAVRECTRRILPMIDTAVRVFAYAEQTRHVPTREYAC